MTLKRRIDLMLSLPLASLDSMAIQREINDIGKRGTLGEAADRAREPLSRPGGLHQSISDVTIYHNRSCGTSRNALALIRHAGIEPTVIEYLTAPPSKEKLRELAAAMDISVRDLLREKGTSYAELKLFDRRWSDDELLDFMQAHPILINRPIVITTLGVANGRRQALR